MHQSRKGYYTRIGWPIWAILMGTVSALCAAFYWELLWKSIVYLAIVETLAVGLIVQTEYVIESDGWLQISDVFNPKTTIAISQIQRIESITDFSFAPAYSPNRLAIHFSKNQMVFISPESQSNFIANLKAINPAIVVKLND
jgi:hypothetical protein